MDEALAKTGEWPNVALIPGTHTHAATGSPVEQPENTRIGRSRGACRPDGADCEHEPADVENGAQDGSECDTREKLEADVMTTFGDGLVRSIIMRLLDRQSAITERKTAKQWEEQASELVCKVNELEAERDRALEKGGKLFDKCLELTAERDELRDRLKIQANSFQKLERDNAKMRDTLARVRELAGDA